MATITEINGKAFRASVRIAPYPAQHKSFSFKKYKGKKAAKKAAKDWGQEAEVSLKKTDPGVANRSKELTFRDVADIYVQTRCGFKLNGLRPRDALVIFKADQSNACIPIGHRKQITGKNLNTPVSHLDWWCDRLEGMPLRKLKSIHINAALTALNNGKRRPSTINRYQSYVHAAFELVITGRQNRNEWIEDNPAPKGKLPEDNQRNVTLKKGQATKLISACKRSDNDDLFLIFQIGIATGARQGNIMGLRWDRIDLETGRVSIPANEMKNGKKFATMIRGEALEILNRRKIQMKSAKVQNLFNDEFVFPSDATNREAGFPRKAWTTALQRAGIENMVDPSDPNNTGFHFHDLRHTFATKAAAKGASQEQLMKVMGHSSPQMTSRYVDMDIDDVAHLFE